MRKALIIGINNYPNAKLKGCINDASELAGILKTNGNGSPNFDVKLKTDISSQAELKSSITQLFSGDCEAALFYFSGHGFVDITGGFLVTPDYQKNNEGVSMEQILTLANNSKIKNRIIILDCCHSGMFGISPVISQSNSIIAKGTTILTASRENESSIELNGHGVFTSLLLDALAGGAADLKGDITPGSVYAHIDQALGAWGQRPVFKTNIDSFISLRKIDPSVPLETLRKLIDYFPSPQDEYPLDPSFEETNSPNIPHEVIEPYSNPANIATFKQLQKMQSVGLVLPYNAPYMYYAAMESKSCKLTALGYHYWKLAKEDKI